MTDQDITIEKSFHRSAPPSEEEWGSLMALAGHHDIDHDRASLISMFFCGYIFSKCPAGLRIDRVDLRNENTEHCCIVIDKDGNETQHVIPYDPNMKYNYNREGIDR